MPQPKPANGQLVLRPHGAKQLWQLLKLKGPELLRAAAPKDRASEERAQVLTHHILLGYLARRPEEGGVNPRGQCPDCLRLELVPQKALQRRLCQHSETQHQRGLVGGQKQGLARCHQRSATTTIGMCNDA